MSKPYARCRLSADCEFGPHAAADHPCGQRSEKPGEPCRYCSEPVPGPEVNGGACPNCWTPATVPDLKAMFAPYGVTVDPVIR